MACLEGMPPPESMHPARISRRSIAGRGRTVLGSAPVQLIPAIVLLTVPEGDGVDRGTAPLLGSDCLRVLAVRVADHEERFHLLVQISWLAVVDLTPSVGASRPATSSNCESRRWASSCRAASGRPSGRPRRPASRCCCPRPTHADCPRAGNATSNPHLILSPGADPGVPRLPGIGRPGHSKRCNISRSLAREILRL